MSLIICFIIYPREILFIHILGSLSTTTKKAQQTEMRKVFLNSLKNTTNLYYLGKTQIENKTTHHI